MKRFAVKGFTLIELLIVIIILGLLASIVAPQMFSRVDTSRVQTAKTQISMIETAVNTFRIDLGRFPETLEELRKSTDSRWQGPYLPKDVPLDPWGNPYAYEVTGQIEKPFVIGSLGPSGKAGADDSITN